jgi:hypothetical protein
MNARMASLPHESRKKSSRFFLPIDNRQKIEPPIAEEYFGNSVSMVSFTSSLQDLLEAASVSSSQKTSAQLADIALSIRSGILHVDDKQVRTELTLFKAIPYGMRLYMNTKPGGDDDCMFNTWAEIGADVEWNIPGVPGAAKQVEQATSGENLVKAESFRRGGVLWTNGLAFVMPRRKSADTWEVHVELKECHMDNLLKDKVWMSWADGVSS